MSLQIECDKCKEEINTQGALIFSPPSMQHTKKLHLCTGCWNSLNFWLYGHSAESTAARAYQVIGTIADFEKDSTETALDYFSALSIGDYPKGDILPFVESE